jgi:hypothetical protein
MSTAMRTTMRTVLGLSALLLSCVDDVVSDPSFDRWCGDSLCEWLTDEGAIARTPTWHTKDYAVELVGGPVQISQSTDTKSACFVVKLISDVDPATQTSLQVDFNDDGSVDYDRPLPRAAWKLAQFPISAPARYLGARFILRKEKPGHAVVAQLRVETALDCTEPALRLEGEPCAADAQCASDICCANRCVPDEDAC